MKAFHVKVDIDLYLYDCLGQVRLDPGRQFRLFVNYVY